MKKLLIAIALLAGPRIAFADLGDQITASLIDHVAAHSQYTTKGDNRLVLLASIVQIGKLNGSSIAQLRFGFTGTANPDNGVSRGAGYVGDIYFNAAPFIRKYVHLEDNWTFLNSVEVGPNYAYDFRDHHAYGGVSVGLAFGLNPKP